LNFKPEQLEVEGGKEVVLVFENNGRMSHNVTIPELGVATDTIGPGRRERIRFTPEEAGTYTFVCSVPGHKEAGMTGELTVR